MARCADCGVTFGGEPWRYRGDERVHVTCPRDLATDDEPPTPTGSNFDTWSAAFLARYRGRCIRCGRWFPAGEPIRRRGQQYRHDICG